MLRHWRSFITILLAPLSIFLANLFLISPLFSGEYTQWVGSIETAFIAQAKFVVEHFPHLSFFPYWYAGFPFHLFHTPLLLTSIILLSKTFSVSVAAAYRIIAAISYSLVPVSVYFLGKKLGKGFIAGLTASVIYSAWPSASILSSILAEPIDIFSNLPWRFTILTYYGEGPHTLSLVFLPLAALFFWKVLENPSKKQIILASFFIALCGLASAFGLISLVILISVMTLVKSLAVRDWLAPIKIGFVVGVISVGLSAFWYNLSFFKNLFAFSDASFNIFSGQLTLIFILAILTPILLLIIHSVLRRFFSKQEALSSVLIWVLFLFSVIVIWEKARIAILPQAIRYTAEFDLGVALVVGITFGIAVKHFYSRVRQAKQILILLTIVFLGVSLQFYLDLFPKTRAASQPHQDITKTAEYKIAKWIEENTKDKRVYLTGNYSFWLNTFVKSPQLRGGGDQAIANPWIKHAIYQINKGSDGEIALYWLKIFNVDTIVVNLLSSPNLYKDYSVPEKFAILGTPIIEERGDQIFRVPLKDPSQAKVVSLTKMNSLKRPINAVDKQPISEYVAWLETAEPGRAKLETIDNDHYQISANVNSGEAILVHFNYDPGWRAKSNLGPAKVRSDVLGQLLLVPTRPGKQTISLRHTIATNQWFGYGITLLTLILLKTDALNLKKLESSKSKNLSSKPNSD